LPKTKAKPAPKKKSNVGLKASKFTPVKAGGLRLSFLKRANRNTLVGVIVLLAIVGGFLIYRSLADSITSTNSLQKGTTFVSGNTLTSSNGTYQAIFQSNGSLAVRVKSTGAVVWGCGCGGLGGVRMLIGSTGNLAILNSGGSIVWQTYTANLGGSYLQIRNDGVLVLYSGYGTPVWSDQGGILVSGCTNPMAGMSYADQQIDRGVDNQFSNGQPVRAACNGVIRLTHLSGWGADNTFIVLQLTSYPTGHPEMNGWCMYYAEDIIPTVSVGQTVTAGQTIGTADAHAPSTVGPNPNTHYNGSMEWGWAANYGTQNPVTSSPRASGDGPTAAGYAMANFLHSLGVNIRDPFPVGPFVAGTHC